MTPTTFDCVARLDAELGCAIVPWRVGAGADDVQYSYYKVQRFGDLLEVEPPEPTRRSEPKIGFRQIEAQ